MTPGREPERGTPPAPGPAPHLCPLNAFPLSCSGWKVFSLCPGCGGQEGPGPRLSPGGPRQRGGGNLGSHGPVSTPAPGPGTPSPHVSTHPGAKVDLEDGTVAAATEQVVLGQVHGHGHDGHVEQHREQELARRDLPQLGVWVR